VTRFRHRSADAEGTTSRAGSRWVRVLAPALLVLAAVLVPVVHVPQHDRVSALDEYAYIDYMDKISHNVTVRQGQEVGPFARNYYACHGVEIYRNQPEHALFAPRRDLCDQADRLDDDKEFPLNGMVSADIYTPAYFAVTWLVAEPLQALGIADEVPSWRLAGGLWLALSALLLYAGAMRFGAKRSTAWAASMAMLFSSVAFWSNTYVSTDATALFAGALMLYLGAGVLAGRTHPLLFGVAAAVLTALKLQNFLAVGAVALFLGLTWLVRRKDDRYADGVPWYRDRLLTSATLGVVAAMATQVAWTLLRAHLSEGAPPLSVYSEGWNVNRLLVDMTTFFPKSFDTFSTEVVWSVPQFMVNTFLKLVVGGAVVGAILGAPVLGLVVWVATGDYIPAAPRYGISLIPIYLAITAIVISSRPRVGGLVAGVASATFLFSLATFH
jgi:hypothetical protein